MAKATTTLSWNEGETRAQREVEVDFFLNSKACAEFNNSNGLDAQDGSVEVIASGLNWTNPIGPTTDALIEIPNLGTYRVVSAVPVEGYGVSVTTFIAKRSA